MRAVLASTFPPIAMLLRWMGHPEGWGERRECGRLLAANDTPPYPTMKLSERVGHPGLWEHTVLGGSNPTSHVKLSDMGTRVGGGSPMSQNRDMGHPVRWRRGALGSNPRQTWKLFEMGHPIRGEYWSAMVEML